MILVTGGAGFIGSNLIAALEERGESEIVICDTLGTGDKWRNLAKREIAELVLPDELGDVLESGSIEVVFHLGASSSTTETDVDFIVANNFALSLALWNWCAESGARFIYASSAATYGDGSNGFTDDGSVDALALLRPLNPYGWSKHLFDRRVARLLTSDAARPEQWAGLKFFNAFGPNEYHKGDQQSVLAKNAERILGGETVRLYKSHHPDYADGGQLRDFVWVGDCVDVMLWLLDNPQVSGLFNCGTGKAESFQTLIEAAFQGAGHTPRIEYVEMPESLREHYQYFTEADLSHLRGAGYQKPFTPTTEAAKRYVSDYLSQPDPYR
jgi:ADP-L-glycero-D-manno-heptose 6-epimerase